MLWACGAGVASSGFCGAQSFLSKFGGDLSEASLFGDRSWASASATAPANKRPNRLGDPEATFWSGLGVSSNGSGVRRAALLSVMGVRSWEPLLGTWGGNFGKARGSKTGAFSGTSSQSGVLRMGGEA